MAQVPAGFVPDGFEPDAGPNLQAQGGDTIRGEDPNAPSLMRRLQDALGHAAQPDSVGDFLGLLIPSEAVPVTSFAKDMARVLRRATKESPSFRGILPKLVQVIRERPKNLQDFQARGFNELPLMQQMEHLPQVPAPPVKALPAPLRTIRSPETPPVAAAPRAAAAPASTAARTLTAEERAAVDALVQQGYTESDVLAQLEKMREPSVTPPVKLKQGIQNDAEMKEYLRLTKAGKTHKQAVAIIEGQRDMTQRLGLPTDKKVQIEGDYIREHGRRQR